MKYLILIYGNEAQSSNASQADTGKMLQEYLAYGESLRKGGAYLAGEGLKPIASATTIRTRNGKTTHTDGPFAETKEQLGGFYMIEAPNLEKALELGAQCPGAKTGSIEVRPVMDYSTKS